jgi:hypothetical protein
MSESRSFTSGFLSLLLALPDLLGQFFDGSLQVVELGLEPGISLGGVDAAEAASEAATGAASATGAAPASRPALTGAVSLSAS